MPAQPAEAIDLLIVGHVTEDLLDGRSVLGGSATYASLTARNLGARVALLTSAGWEPGLVDLLRDVRVARLASDQTTRFRNRYVDGRREQRIEALARRLTWRHVPPEWRKPQMVLLAPVANEVDPEMAGVFRGAQVAVTPQGWMRRWSRKGRIQPMQWSAASRVLQQADATILSEDDVPDPKLIDQYATQAGLLVVTLGRGGARIYQQGAAYHSAAFKPERETDPTGAGDVFAAAFLLKLHETRDPRLSADFANCVASFAVEQSGPAGVPTREQVEARWHSGARLQP